MVSVFGRLLKNFFSQSTNVFSALEAFDNDTLYTLMFYTALHYITVHNEL